MSARKMGFVKICDLPEVPVGTMKMFKVGKISI